MVFAADVCAIVFVKRMNCGLNEPKCEEVKLSVDDAYDVFELDYGHNGFEV